MKELIIVGAGGFGKELYGYIESDIRASKLAEVRIKGFLDIDISAFDSMGLVTPYLGSEDDYVVEPDDIFIVAIGDIQIRTRVVEKLTSRSVKFFTFVHSTAYVDRQATIGEGVVVCPYATITSNAVVNDHSILNIYSSVAHDSLLGRFSILSPYATLNGNVRTDENLFMGTRSTILPGVKVGKNCIISAGVVVSKDMHENLLAFPKSRTEFKER